MGGTWPKVQGCLEPQKLEEAGRTLPGASEGARPLDTLIQSDLWPPDRETRVLCEWPSVVLCCGCPGTGTGCCCATRAAHGASHVLPRSAYPADGHPEARESRIARRRGADLPGWRGGGELGRSVSVRTGCSVLEAFGFSTRGVRPKPETTSAVCLDASFLSVSCCCPTPECATPEAPRGEWGAGHHL